VEKFKTTRRDAVEDGEFVVNLLKQNVSTMAAHHHKENDVSFEWSTTRTAYAEFWQGC
jgi:hypothetical protein